MQSGPKENGRVDWSVNSPNRPFLGNGYTWAEAALAHGTAVALTAFVLGYWWAATETPALWQAALLALVAYDVAGGVVANHLNSCKRFYHVAELPAGSIMLRVMRKPVLFTTAHVHPIVMAIAFGFPLETGLAWYAAVWLSVLLVTRTPLYIRRPTAVAFCLFALILNQTIFPLPIGLEWFIPCLFLKLVLGHAVQEEPYRP